MQFDTLANLIVDCLHHFQTAVLCDGSGQQSLKGGLLLRSRFGRLYLKQRIDHIFIDLLCASCIEQRAVDIGCPVIKRREQESQLRGAGNILVGAIVKLLLLGIVAKVGLGQLHGANRALQICISLVGAIRLNCIVLALEGHIVAVRCQKDQIIIVEADMINNLLIKLQAEVLVL